MKNGKNLPNLPTLKLEKKVCSFNIVKKGALGFSKSKASLGSKWDLPKLLLDLGDQFGRLNSETGRANSLNSNRSLVLKG